ncbi:hypothetical protein [Aurantiacibacter rhizosphaerae]|uniref:Uncharacterized protein n=1 Tax=Aurantiacibacter rhizosphaerae TaxID=2691582 RepID=A0A844XGX2_9SPHN|nr:hypothetical protein [Aurantiacibacter rhizosphaerae]MWV28989.1 hypothetical protein [Aurantiacibacter rhizosphaerae]
MPIRLLIALSALLLPAPLLAEDSDATLEGHWAFRIDEATIFVFALDEQEAGGWEGSWTRPETITSNGTVFRDMSGQEIVAPIETALRRNAVQLTFAGPKADGRRDILQFRQTGENEAQLSYYGIPGDPYPLIRVQADTGLGPFDEARIYDRDNAITQAEYVAQAVEPEPVAEAEPEIVAAPVLESEAEMMAEVDSEGEAEAAPESPRIGADFLDGI